MYSILVKGKEEFAEYKELANTTLIKTLQHLNQKNISISVLFTDDLKMQELNKTYRNKDKSTDVLSFAMRDSASFPKTDEVENLGDIVISIEYAKKQAKELEVKLEDELKRLLIHGCLHLLGYEHENVSKEKADEMFNMQEEIFDIFS